MKLPILILVLGAVGWTATRLFAETHAGTDADHAQTTYYASGKMEARYECHGGKRDGTAERWYPNGTKQAEGLYEDGSMAGTWQFWNADGSVDAERTGVYRAGEKIAASTGDAEQATNPGRGD